MLRNRSIRAATVIPVLAYPDVHAAASWLCTAFHLTIRLRIDDHRIQLNVGAGAIVFRELRPSEAAATAPRLGLYHSLTIRIADADVHCAHTRLQGAHIPSDPVTYSYGERQYNALDPWGHAWTFSQSVFEANPAEWGATPVNLLATEPDTL